MGTLLVGAASALWLGILTSISPCPLATNIAAISFVGKRVGSTRRVLLSGLCYALGRTVSYVVLGMFIVAGILSTPGVSMFLQKYMNKFLGPLLIVMGMFILGLIELNLSGPEVGGRIQKLAEKGGLLGAVLLGITFALSFCPLSAALFFGSLVPLSAKHGSRFMLPSFYGIGTGLPVVVFAILIALGAKSVAKTYNRFTRIELWARRVTGAVFILIGSYLSIVHIFGVSW